MPALAVFQLQQMSPQLRLNQLGRIALHARDKFADIAQILLLRRSRQRAEFERLWAIA